MHLQNYFQTIHSALLQSFCPSNWTWKVNGTLQFCVNPSYWGIKMSPRDRLCFLTKNFQSPQIFNISNLIFTLSLRILLKPWTLFQKRQNHNKICLTVKVSQRTEKVEIYLAIERSGPAYFSMDLRQIFESYVFNEFGVILIGKRPYKPEFAHYIISVHLPMI